MGTGGDFARTWGHSGRLEEAVARIRHGQRRSVDLGAVEVMGPEGLRVTRAFVNVVSFGIAGVVDAMVDAGPRWLGGRAAFLLGTAKALASYKNVSVRVRVDGVPWFEGKAFNIAVANGRFFGGGMMIAPQADPCDGRFEVVALGDAKLEELLRMGRKIYSGGHLGEPSVQVTHGTVIEAEAVHPWANIGVDMDGEVPGKLPLRVSLRPKALAFRT
jgi:diacylglycerol kinase family enzyme